MRVAFTLRQFERRLRVGQIAFRLCDSGLKKRRIDLGDHLARFHLRIKVHEQLCILPETWLPTCTFTTGFSVPVAVTAWVMRAARHRCCLITCAPRSGIAETTSRRQEDSANNDGEPWTNSVSYELGRLRLIAEMTVKAMRRYIEIYSIMLRNSLIREMSFKANFLLWMIVEVLWFCGQIVFFSIIFGQVDRIGDWTKWEVVLLVGTHQIIAQLFQAFFFVNVANIPELVRTGKLDSLLVLPIDSQFAVSTKQFGLDSMINAVARRQSLFGHRFPSSASCRTRSRSCFTSSRFAFGIAVHYSIMLSLAAVSFWIVRAQGLVYGYFNFLNIARYPDVIFPGFSGLIFGWIIPVVIIANIPARSDQIVSATLAG